MELALKKTDYLVVDDRNTGASLQTVPSVDGENISLSGNSFSEVLGQDPWAELATPLTKFEILGTWRGMGSCDIFRSPADGRQISDSRPLL